MPRCDDYSREELIRLLEARDRRDATRFGLVWETNEVEREKALNGDFVALDLDPGLSCGEGPWRNLIIEGDNFDAFRFLRMTHAGRVKYICIDPPYNTGNRDFVYNDRFVGREDSWWHSKWCEFMYQRLVLAKELGRGGGGMRGKIEKAPARDGAGTLRWNSFAAARLWFSGNADRGLKPTAIVFRRYASGITGRYGAAVTEGHALCRNAWRWSGDCARRMGGGLE